MILGKCKDCNKTVTKYFTSFGQYYECDCSDTTVFEQNYEADAVHSSSIWWDPMRGIYIDEF